MTAEIAIMNAQAVALAADSAVTFGSKVKNTANKIFALSKFEPVGVMIYNNADFFGLPWETVIKSYRTSLGEKAFGTIQEYADDLVSYIREGPRVRVATADPGRAPRHVSRAFLSIRENTLKLVANEIAAKSKITPVKISALLTQCAKEEDQKLRKQELALSKNRKISIQKKVINKAIAEIFGELPVSSETKKVLVDLGVFVLRNFPIAASSGLVVAGFGRDQLFPSLRSYSIDSFADDQVITARDARCFDITVNDTAVIVPFAQSEVVATLIDGVEPRYQELVDELIAGILREYPSEVLAHTSLSDAERAKIVDEFKKSAEAVTARHLKKLEDIRRQNFSGPITIVVQALPKDELAAMAESLVNLTSFKRKISLDRETVGGPIDVAVISKGDGLIWIKRKHYFEPKLNPQFFDLYYWRERNAQAENRAQAESHPGQT
jgi:hypothetical protein